MFEFMPINKRAIAVTATAAAAVVVVAGGSNVEIYTDR